MLYSFQVGTVNLEPLLCIRSLYCQFGSFMLYSFTVLATCNLYDVFTPYIINLDPLDCIHPFSVNF